MNRPQLVIAGILLATLGIIGCTQDVERATPTPSPVPAIPTPTATPSPTPSPSPPPGPTPTIAPTSTPIPTAIPIPRLVLDVQGPADGTTVQNAAVVVHGLTSPGATLTVNGEVVFVDRDGRFQTEVTLVAGDNRVEVIATDATGTQVSEELLTITFQAPSPQAFFLLITEPVDQSIVSSRTIPLSGRTAAEAVVSVNGVGIAVDELGVFSTMVTLEEGPNIIDVVSTSPGGQVLSAVIAVIFRP